MRDGSSCRMTAYAKINTYLAVTGVRPDGYHALLSHMQAITLSDTLTLTWQAGEGASVDVALTCNRPELPTDGSNLVVRAARAIFAALETRGRSCGGRLAIDLDKQIPMAAGLGGGSADAAATLVGLNGLLGHPLTTDELCAIGTGLGADIPFCVKSVAGEAVSMTARGIGEVLEPAPGLGPSLCVVVACHGEGVSTPWAYRRLDECGVADTHAQETYEAFLSALNGGTLADVSACSYNAFERVVLPERPVARALMDAMIQMGASLVRMSGSGPSVFGVFESEQKAKDCLDALEKQGIAAYLCRPVG